jgi:predicted O-methyltransferase YrrM
MIVKKIQEKLKEIDVDLDDIILGDFDYIGEFTAKKSRSQDSENYKKYGCFFRPNYERGILIYYLIRKFNIESVLEIGFGRGYSTFCAAKAMTDAGIDGKIVTVDPAIDKDKIQPLANFFPKDWFSKIDFYKSYSDDFFEKNERKFDLIYIDGDHRYEAVKKDWNNSKDIYNKFILFDDYHLPGKKQKDIECAKVINEIDNPNKELIIMDRRIFYDDRRILDENIDYGQVLISNPE